MVCPGALETASQVAYHGSRIDTQDVLFRDFAVERVLEVGPAETLLNMAKKTVKGCYAAHDMAKDLNREYLSVKKSADAIYYRVDETDVAEQRSLSSPSLSQDAPVVSAAPTPAAPVVEVSQPAPTAAAPVASIADRPLAAGDVVNVVVALGLKKQREDIAADQSVKKLCGGKISFGMGGWHVTLTW